MDNLHVELAVKEYSIPGVTKHSIDKITVNSINDIDAAYKKLANFKQQTNVNHTPSVDVDNTDSYSKVQKIIFTQAQKYVVARLTRS